MGHYRSKIQRYARPNDQRNKYIIATGQDISDHEIKCAIRKLNNRKSARSDEIKEEIIEMYQNWLIPTLQQMYKQSAINNAIPKEWLKGAMTFIHKKTKQINLITISQ